MSGAAPDERWLVLWDIDGTLLLRASEAHARVMWDTIRDVHGVDAGGMQPARTRAGMTDGQICREILVAAGVDDALIDEQAAVVVARSSDAYEPGDLTAHVNAGIPELLEELHGRSDVLQSLVTGNYEQIARRKLDAAGIGRWFDAGLGGGFGSDHEQREQLPAVARARAGRAARADGSPWPAERTVVIGDTPRDIACARYDSVHVVAIATGPHPTGALSEADAVVSDGAELRDALLRLIDGSGRPQGDPA